jgi:predicted PurR-regulated permease PerM
MRRALAALAITAAIIAGFGGIIAVTYTYPVVLAGVALAVFVGTLAWVVYDALDRGGR